jgi:hypothetical protein
MWSGPAPAGSSAGSAATMPLSLAVGSKLNIESKPGKQLRVLRVVSMAETRRYQHGCHVTQETRVQMRWMTWRAVSTCP